MFSVVLLTLPDRQNPFANLMENSKIARNGPFWTIK